MAGEDSSGRGKAQQYSITLRTFNGQLSVISEGQIGFALLTDY